MTTQSILGMSGVEWKHLCDLVDMVLRSDDTFREVSKKTLFRNRADVEAAQKELKAAGERADLWTVYIEREGLNHPIAIRTKEPAHYPELLVKNEKVIMCVPQRVRVKADQEVLVGIANACCKAVGLHDTIKETGKEPPLSEYGYNLAKNFWTRCHLHWRRSVGASKGAWRRKGYIATYAEVPDYREPEFHEGAKLLYELGEEGIK